jgi:hypothetical protein
MLSLNIGLTNGRDELSAAVAVSKAALARKQRQKHLIDMVCIMCGRVKRDNFRLHMDFEIIVF